MRKPLVFLALLFAATFASAEEWESGTIENLSCVVPPGGPIVVLELDGWPQEARYEGIDLMNALNSCLVQEIEYLVRVDTPGGQERREALQLIVDAMNPYPLPNGSCDSDAECEAKVDRTCIKTQHGRKFFARVTVQGSKCEGDCTDGTKVVVKCTKVCPDPRICA